MYLSAIANFQFILLNVIAIFKKNNNFGFHSRPADGVYKKSIDQWEKRKRNGRRTFAVLYTGLECVTKNQSVGIRVLVQSSIVYAPMIHRFLVFLHVDRNNNFIIACNTQ